MEYEGGGCRAASLRLDARKLHYLAPLLGFFRDKVSEISRRAGKYHSAEFAEPAPYPRVRESGVDLFIESSR